MGAVTTLGSCAVNRGAYVLTIQASAPGLLLEAKANFMRRTKDRILDSIFSFYKFEYPLLLTLDFKRLMFILARVKFRD